MKQDEIIRITHQAGLYLATEVKWMPIIGFEYAEKLIQLAAAEERNKLSQWMIQHSYATGHGDTVEDLLKELEGQVRESERKAFAQIAKDWDKKHPDTNYGVCIAEAIKARSNA